MWADCKGFTKEVGGVLKLSLKYYRCFFLVFFNIYIGKQYIYICQLSQHPWEGA